MGLWIAHNAGTIESFGFGALMGYSVWPALAAGRLMLGNTAFAFVGGVATMWAASSGWNLVLSVVAGIACAAAAGALFGAITSRTDGARFAIASVVLAGCAWWAAAFVVPGFHLHHASVSLANAILVAPAIVALCAWLLDASRQGRAAACVAQDERAAQLVGIDPRAVRLAAVIASASVAGLCGALMVLHRGSASATDFGASQDVAGLAAVVVGGAGSPLGAFAGALVLALAESTRALGAQPSIVDAAALLGFSTLLPGGLASVVARVRR